MRYLFITLAIVAALFVSTLAIAHQYNRGHGMMGSYTGFSTGNRTCLNTLMRGQGPGRIGFQSGTNMSLPSDIKTQ
jgi:hypothetical protein